MDVVIETTVNPPISCVPYEHIVGVNHGSLVWGDKHVWLASVGPIQKVKG